MKQSFYIIILFSLFACKSNAQKSNGDLCYVLLKPTQVYVDIYNSPNGRILYSIINDTIKEDYFSLLVRETNDGWLRVIPSSILDTSKAEGWIKISNTGIYTNNYSSSLKLYKEAKQGSPKLIEIKEYNNDMLSIIEYKDCWLLVETKNGKTTTSGWLSPKDQCANPYSTCN